MDKIKRIEEIKEILNKDFIGLKIGKFAYCETSNDFITASYFANSVEACIEITKNKSHFEKEHKKLVIFDSYIRELMDLGGLDF